MEIRLDRFIHNHNDTVGRMFIDGKFYAYTLEDEHRDVKVKGETRIPAGTYEIKLRTEGGFHTRYLTRFGADFHKGMLHLQNVPGFEFILIHTGNTERDTEGCILVGKEISLHSKGDSIQQSTAAYKELYPVIRDELLKGNKVEIKIGNHGST